MHILKLLPRFREAERELEQFEMRERWTASDLHDYQLHQINAIWSSARTQVSYYRDLCARQRLPDRFASLTEYSALMPILPKQRVRDAPDSFLSSDPRPGRWHRTGGSTGLPMGIYWEHAAHRHVLRSKYRNEQSHGLDIFDKKLFLWGHSGAFAPGGKGLLHKVLRPVQDRLRNRLRLSAYDLSDEQLHGHILKIQRHGPRGLYGYSSAIDLVSKVAAERSLEVPQLKVAILTAEPADSRMLDRVSQRMHCKAVLEYGATECAFMAGHSVKGGIRTRDDVVLLETVPNAFGSCDIVITVLGNSSFPLMRYAIEDVTSSPKIQPKEGFGILSDIQGRNNDMLVSQSGRRLHGMAIKHTLEHWPAIRRFTAYQNQRGDLDVMLETEKRLSESVRSALQAKFTTMLDGCVVTIREVDEIPGNAAGKHRWIVSELALQSMDESD